MGDSFTEELKQRGVTASRPSLGRLTRDKPVTATDPAHYRSHPSGVECIEIVEHMSFTLGNVIKYTWRADMKNGLEDLKKAKWYLEREIARREKK